MKRKQLSISKIVLFPLLLSLFSLSIADAQIPTASDQALMKAKQNTVESQSRQRIDSILSRLCPGTCELLDLKVLVSAPKAVGEVLPGFDQASASEVVVEGIEGKIMLDKALPSSFKTNLPQMLQYRLNDLSNKVLITTVQLAFPKPQNAPQPPPLEDAQEMEDHQVNDEPIVEPAPTETPKQPEPTPTIEPRIQQPTIDPTAVLWEKVFFWAPLLIVMLFATFLTLYVVKAIRRLENQESLQKLQKEQELAFDQQNIDQKIEMPNLEEMKQLLRKSRTIQNKLLRKWLDDSLSDVAQLIKLLGAELLDDLKQDPSMKRTLETLGEELAQSRNMPSAQQAWVLYQSLQARLLALQVTYDEKQSLNVWEFLQGLNLKVIKRLYDSLAISEKEHLISQLSIEVRPQFLNLLNQAERNQLMLQAGAEGILSKTNSIDLANRLKRQAEEMNPVGEDLSIQVNLISEMIDSLSFQAQLDSVMPLQIQKPQIAQAVLSKICLEGVIYEAPETALADAVIKTQFNDLIDLLRGTQPYFKEAILAVIPKNELSKYTEELSYLHTEISQAQYLKVRASFLHVLSQTIKRDGLDLLELNQKVIQRIKI
jgi:hypothetical protein